MNLGNAVLGFEFDNDQIFYEKVGKIITDDMPVKYYVNRELLKCPIPFC
jgi:hypothetical protein